MHSLRHPRSVVKNTQRRNDKKKERANWRISRVLYKVFHNHAGRATFVCSLRSCFTTDKVPRTLTSCINSVAQLTLGPLCISLSRFAYSGITRQDEDAHLLDRLYGCHNPLTRVLNTLWSQVYSMKGHCFGRVGFSLKGIVHLQHGVFN